MYAWRWTYDTLEGERLLDCGHCAAELLREHGGELEHVELYDDRPIERAEHD